MGLQSLPVAFGTETAKWITVATIDVTQLSVAAYLAFGLDQKIYGAVLLGLVLPQVMSHGQLAYHCPAVSWRHQPSVRFKLRMKKAGREAFWVVSNPQILSQWWQCIA